VRHVDSDDARQFTHCLAGRCAQRALDALVQLPGPA
jgi:hypothetical protein